MSKIKEIEKLNKQKMNNAEIARRVGLTRERVRQVLHRNGKRSSLANHSKTELTLVAEYLREYGYKVTAKKLKKSYLSLYGIKRRHFPNLEVKRV